ncbi:MAG: 3-hydroxybutyrate dehydrogenase [Parvularculaceae bacterium]|nr:3-hydroxybutyrate dehydrogenase [Parvularculaceae bacterium]
MSLKDKVAVITGSTSGIGLAIAEGLAKAGAHVVLNGLGSEADIKAAVARVATHGTRVSYDPANMLRHNQIADMIEKAESELGSVDILVNNAGIQHVAPIEDFPVAKLDAIIAINLVSSFHTIKAVFAGMKKRGRGRIINIASAHGLVASPFKSAYVAAKHGIVGLTKTIALEGAEHGVTCNAICPGYVKTPLVEGQIADTAKARGMSEEDVVKKVMLDAQPTKEFITVEQIGALAVFLCSDDAAQITGAAHQIDGGWVAQ